MSTSPFARPVFVLGMHRSGTSCLAGCLEEAGLYLGEVNRAAPFNKKGNRENRDAMTLNDTVLALNHARWDHPPAGEVIWNENTLVQLDEVIATYPSDAVWGLKDPRVLLTLETWQKRVQPRFVGTFRHPSAVVSSLMTRAEAWGSPMVADNAYQLWQAYNARLLAAFNEAAFPIVRYDQDAQSYVSKVQAIAHDLGLPRPDAIGFHDPSLQNQLSDDRVPDAHRALWESLNEVAV